MRNILSIWQHQNDDLFWNLLMWMRSFHICFFVQREWNDDCQIYDGRKLLWHFFMRHKMILFLFFFNFEWRKIVKDRRWKKAHKLEKYLARRFYATHSLKIVFTCHKKCYRNPCWFYAALTYFTIVQTINVTKAAFYWHWIKAPSRMS